MWYVERRRRAVDDKTNLLTRKAEQTAHEASPTLDRRHKFDLGKMTSEAFEIGQTNKRSIDPRRTHFEHIGALNRILDVK